MTVDPATGRFDGYAWSENLGWISFSPADPSPGVSLTLTRVTVTFSEPVTGFEAADLVVDNGAIGDFSGDGDTYAVMVTPEADGTVTVELPADAAEDMAGNGSTAGGTLSRAYDAERPAVTLSSSSGDPTSVSPIEVTVTFSEPVTGFAADDVVVTNGTVGDFAGEGASYAVSVIPSADGVVTVDVPADVARDAVGNGNLAAATLVRAYDTTPPNVSLSSSSSN